MFFADILTLIIGCIYLICSFALKINTKRMLRVCGILLAAISVLSYFLFPRLRIFEIAFLAFSGLYQFFNFLVYVDGSRAPCPYALCVPGAQVKETGISGIFLRRLNCALARYHYYDRKPMIIVCGAKGSRFPEPEAKVGADYLLSQGVPSEKLITETDSHNTVQSFANVKGLLKEKEAPLLITTSDWGMLRARLLARRAGLNARVIGCRTSFLWYVSYSLREMIALVYYLIVRKRSR